MEAGREIREMSTGRVTVVCVVGLGAVLLAMRFLQGWVERRFGLAAVPAGMVAVAAGLGPVLVAVQLLGWAPPIVDEDERRRAAERAIARDRKGRGWIALLLGFMLVLLAVQLLGSLDGVAWDGTSAIGPIVLGTMAISVAPGALPSQGAPAGEADARDQALRGEAMRLGYVVLLGLGGVAVVVSALRPVLAAQCWGPVLAASLLASQVRMMMAPREPGGSGRGMAWWPGGRGAAARREIGEVSRRQVMVVVGSYFALGALACLVQGPIERRFGIPEWLSEVGTIAGGVLLVTWATHRAGWGTPILGEEARRLAAERSVLRDRRYRPWLILSCVLAMLPCVVALLGATDGLRIGVHDWGEAVFVCSVVWNNAMHVLPSRGEVLGAVDARDQADRRGATRVGHVVLLVLGVGAAAVAERWPMVGAQCWGLVLLASVLVAQVWMMMLSWQPGASVPAAAD